MARKHRSFIFKSRYLWVSALLCFCAFGFGMLTPPKIDRAIHLDDVAILMPPYQMPAPAAGPVSASDKLNYPDMWSMPSLSRDLPPAFFRDSGKSPVPPVKSAPVLSAAALAAPMKPPLATSTSLRIAIVIDDVGPDYRGARQAVALPAPVTLAILPYAANARDVAQKARGQGHELLIHVPMEPEDVAHNNPGPDPLLVTLPPDEIRRRLIDKLSSFEGYVGINNHMGSRFTENSDALRPVLMELASRNLLFLDSMTTAKSAGPALAKDLNMKFAARNIFLDNVIEPAAIRAQLRQTEIYARRHGSAIAIGHPHAITLKVLAEWIPEAEARGFKFVPISQLANRHYAIPVTAQGSE